MFCFCAVIFALHASDVDGCWCFNKNYGDACANEDFFHLFVNFKNPLLRVSISVSHFRIELKMQERKKQEERKHSCQRYTYDFIVVYTQPTDKQTDMHNTISEM